MTIENSSFEALRLNCKWTEAQPRLHGGRDFAVTRERNTLALTLDRGEAHPDSRHRSQVRRYVEIDFEARIGPAEIDIVGRAPRPPQFFAIASLVSLCPDAGGQLCVAGAD